MPRQCGIAVLYFSGSARSQNRRGNLCHTGVVWHSFHLLFWKSKTARELEQGAGPGAGTDAGAEAGGTLATCERQL